MERRNPEIPSEFIEPYLKDFLMIQVESVAYGLHTPDEVREHLKGVDYFVSCYCGVHARIATNNMYNNFIRLSDENMISLCKNTMKIDSSDSDAK